MNLIFAVGTGAVAETVALRPGLQFAVILISSAYCVAEAKH
jgi:hypothetical protein